MYTSRYKLEPYKGLKSRHTCPGCDHKHTFTKYIDSESGEYVDDSVGRCDRENNCAYHRTPTDYFNDNPDAKPKRSYSIPQKTKPNKIENVDFLPFWVFEMSVTQFQKCDLFPFLESLFGREVAQCLGDIYSVGTSKKGITTFFQRDVLGRIRQGKKIKYNSVTGKRDKEYGARFIGKNVLDETANLKQCFFGEYSLSKPENKNKPIAIVESEKTAMIATVFYPQFVFLATGGKYGCRWTTKEVCEVLRGKTVVLFPDLGAYEDWTKKAKELAINGNCKVVVSDTLERNASDEDRKHGLDIADYLLKNRDSTGLAITDFGYPVIWDFKLNDQSK